MTENLDRFEPRWSHPPPGDTILDILEEKNLSLEEFARHPGIWHPCCAFAEA